MTGYTKLDDPIRFFGHCGAPTCIHETRDLFEDGPFVHWDGVSFSVDNIKHQLSPMAKLAFTANLTPRQEKSNSAYFPLFLHPECAVRWATHLIADATKAVPDPPDIRPREHRLKAASRRSS